MTRPLTGSERQRLRTSANLWRALIPLVALIVVMVVFLWPHGQTATVQRVNVPSVLSAATGEVGFTPLTPTGLPSTWKATSDTVTAPAGSTAGSIRIGFLTPNGKYAELFQSNDNPDAVRAQYGPTEATTPVTVAGVSWTGYQTNQSRQLLQRTFAASKVTVIVTGPASQAELVTLAASMR